MKEKWLGFCRFVDSLHPVRMVALGYLTYVLAGWVLLALPNSHAAAPVPALDALFTSASAVSTTGLTTVSTGKPGHEWPVGTTARAPTTMRRCRTSSA